MSVRPTRFRRVGPGIQVEIWHDELQHGGTAALSSLTFLRDMNGDPTDDFMPLACPVVGCGAISFHPIGGGCDARRVQLLFVLMHLRRLRLQNPDITWEQVKAFVRTRVQAMDGPNRWQNENTSADDEE